MRYIRAMFLAIALFAPICSAAEEMPGTAEFMGMLTACASGASTDFDAKLLGSIKNLYEGEQSNGYARLKTQTEFLNLLPEKDKLEGYRLYTECIKAIVANPKESLAQRQRDFLNEFDFTTTIDKVKEVFGAPSKSLDQYLRFEGAELDFFVHVTDNGIDRVAVLANEKRDTARIPLLNMGNTIAGKELFFYNLGDIKFRYIPELCGDEDIGEGHARFLYKVTKPCYFGRPGSYMNYVFVFQPSFDENNTCIDDFLEGKKYSDFKCNSSLDMKPVLALVYSEEEGYDAPGDANSLMEWIYNF